MSGYWVLPKLFKAQAANVDWERHGGLLGYRGPHQPARFDPAPVQLRWLLHPSLGLPRSPFVVSRHDYQGGMSTQELANLDGWEDIEIVGLPVDDSWADTGYDLVEQGLVNDMGSPFEAARHRLHRGAPRLGWAGLSEVLPDGSTATLPDWEPVELDRYLEELLATRLLQGIHAMLAQQPDPAEHAGYTEAEHDGSGALDPHLLIDGAAPAGGQRAASSAWRPLGLLLLSAGSDPLASLATGYGTAIGWAGGWNDLYRISVRHVILAEGRQQEVHLADVVTVPPKPVPLSAPRHAAATLIGHTRPQVVDGPALDSVGVTWQRPINPAYTAPWDDSPQATGYAIGRLSRDESTILLTRRPADVGGHQPFVAAKPAGATPVLFVDQRVRSAFLGGEVIGDPRPADHVYGVAAQDVFGRWSPWATAPYAELAEPERMPTIRAVTVAPSGVLTVDFGWDWSDRSPELVEIVAGFADQGPATTLLLATLEFGGGAAPWFGGVDVEPLGPELEPDVDWGEDQDLDPSRPDTRWYRLRAEVAFDFAGLSRRTVRVRARGQGHLAGQFGQPTGSFGAPFDVAVYDPAPPPPPVVPEAPQWAALPDTGGISRAVVHWSSAARAVGYHLYEATETSLLAALPGSPAVDLARPLTDRLAVLRSADLPALRRQFRRINDAPVTVTSYEVALPRGSEVLHLYAVTAVSANNVESGWPSRPKAFVAVAAARTQVPRPPILEVGLRDGEAGVPVADVRVRVDTDPPVGRVELHRVIGDELAQAVDSMGPRLEPALRPVNGLAETVDHAVGRSWQRIWYRAVAWSAGDDLAGVVESRSPPSAAVPILSPPSDPPTVSDLRVNEPGSTDVDVLVSWLPNAPFRMTAFGAHRTVVEAHDADGAQLARLDGRLDTMVRLTDLASLPGPTAVPQQIHRVWSGDADRLYAWVTRPAADMPLRIEVKVIDPLGRIGRAVADIGPAVSTLPIIEELDPDSGRPGDIFTIRGRNLTVHQLGDPIVLYGLRMTLWARDRLPAALTVVGPPTPGAIAVVVPELWDGARFGVIVSRRDGAEAVSDQTFTVWWL